MKIENKINKIVSEELGNIDESPFSRSGFDLYLESITSYSVQLFGLSQYLARKQGIETIPKSIVQKASEKLHKSRNDKILNLILSIAGLLIGLSVSHLITLILNDTVIALNSMIFIVTTGFTGFFLIGYYLFK